MTQFKIIGRYKMRRRESFYFELVSDCFNQNFKDLVNAKYPVVDLFNT